MREFFRGWKRKAGCVTLMMVCFMMGMWMRSHFFIDLVNINSHHVRSVRSMMVWVKAENWAQFSMHMSPELWETTTVGDQDWSAFLSDDANELALFDFHFGKGTSNNGLFIFTYWAIPYWSTAVPLTLLSAYLLISNPRPANRSTESN